MKRKLALLLTAGLLLTFVGCKDTGSGAPSTETSISTEMSAPKTDTQPSTESAPTETAPTTAEEELSLKQLFAEHGMKTGICFNANQTSNIRTSKIVLKQFNSITMENAMKPESILNRSKSVSEGKLVVSFGQDMIKMLKWAKQNDIGVRGHTLIWHSQTPDWIFYEDFDTKKSLVSREVMLDRMENYIKDVFDLLSSEGYADIIYAYDVANECWMEDGSMRDSYWLQTIGDDYLWYAFSYARKYAPSHIELYYNDYNEQFKTETLVNFVQTLKDENGNSLIDGVGFQAHLYTRDDLTQYFETVDAVSATGLKIELTELDVCLGAYQDTLPATEENLKTQGRFYYDLINGLFSRIDAGTLRMDALTFWGYTDGMSWRGEASPLLYDKDYNPKYAYYGAMQIRDQAGFDE